MTLLLLMAVTSAAMSAALVAWVRVRALKRNIIDFPNMRSSHTVPTPRGGGLAMVVTFLGGLAVLDWQDWIDLRLAATLALAGSAIAFVGHLDDRRQLSARVRFAVHAC